MVNSAGYLMIHTSKNIIMFSLSLESSLRSDASGRDRPQKLRLFFLFLLLFELLPDDGLHLFINESILAQFETLSLVFSHRSTGSLFRRSLRHISRLVLFQCLLEHQESGVIETIQSDIRCQA